MIDITNLNVTSTLEQYINSGQTIVVDFFAPWCGPCKMLAPHLEKLQNVTVVKINGDHPDPKVQVEVNGIMEQFDITAYPTVLIFKNKKYVKKIVGLDIQSIKAAV